MLKGKVMKINAITNLKNIVFGARQLKTQQTQTAENPVTPAKNGSPQTTLPAYQKRYMRLLEGVQADGLEMSQLCEAYARKYVVYKDENSKIGTITKEHCYLAFLEDVLEYAKSVQRGEVDYTREATNTSSFIAEASTEWVWERGNADNTLNIIAQEYEKTLQELKEKSCEDGFVSGIMIDENLMKAIDDLVGVAMSETRNYDIKNVGGNASFYMSAILVSSSSSDRAFTSKIKDFLHRLSLGSTTDSVDENSPIMPYYQDIASRVIKNADKNYNMFVTYSENDESAPEYFINNLVEQLSSIEEGKFKNLKPNKVKTIIFNGRSNFNIIANECAKCANDTDTQYFIVIKDIKKVFYSSLMQNDDGLPVISVAKLDNSIRSKAKNLHFILLTNQDDYYSVMKERIFEKSTRDYQNLQIPIMDEGTLKEQVLSTKNYIASQIENNIDDDALLYVAGLPLNSKGSKYDNFISFIKNLAFYYDDSEKITKEMVQQYWETTQKSDLATQDNPYDIIFNTGKNLDSIKGTPMVRKQAESVVYEMTNFPKTKGYIIYNADDSSVGRMNCAKAIAGELKIPMICINASDFAMRDLDTVNQDPMKAIEVKMSKLINMLKTQAQANPNKMVMLFIANFDNFASDPIYGLSSLYEQQAFQKLIKEMNRSASSDNYNILVMGSSDHPEITREDIIRSNLFMDSITIFPPRTPENFEEITKDYAGKKGFKFADEETLAHFVKLMHGAYVGYTDTVDFLDKANVLAHKRGSDEISIPDINEAYLLQTEGEVSEFNISQRQKDLIIRHEGGHALNLQFMYNLFKQRGDDLRIGDSVMNIALDPRGGFLGCVYHAKSYENTVEDNLETIMSDIVCSFGGNSAEEKFFNMAGSWGISQDMENANRYARIAVTKMGLGARTGYLLPEYSEDGDIHYPTEEDMGNYSKDVKVILENAKLISDKIVRCYSEFLEEFSRNNISKFATGNCIITGDDFAQSLKDWEKRQSPRKKAQIAKLKKEVLCIIECTKYGKIYKTIDKFNPLYRLY